MQGAVAAERHALESISCGRDQTLALVAGGRVFGWGGEGSGRLAADLPDYCTTGRPSARPVEVDTRHALTSAAAGYGFSLGTTADGRVLMWSANPARVGRGPAAADLAESAGLSKLPSVCSVVAGELMAGAIDDAGAIHTWGLNSDGALGRSTTQINASPGRVEAVPLATQLALGKGYMLALTREGRVYAWGSNAAGQLGDGGTTSGPTPRRLLLEPRVRSVAAGATHALAVTEEGAVFAWGSNQHGQLGCARPAYSTRSLRVELPERARRVAAGLHFSLALGESGQVYAWGWNGRGQLGLGDTEARAVAEPVPGLESTRAIAAGETHVAVLTQDDLKGWGNNSAGQIGAGERVRLRPLSFLP